MKKKRADSGVSGCLVVDKPAGMTSHDVVDRARRALGTRKVGHAGTLDPSATGVLVLGIGRGTKLLQFVTGTSKSYVGEIVFGTETDSLDADGEVTASHDMTVVPAEVAAATETFVGDIEQIPPMVSAVKVDGKRLHELAREGKVVEREPRPVTVHRFDVAPTADPLVYRAEVDCSSGTYIRTLAADLGTALGGGAHLRNLRRTAVGAFTIDRAVSLDDLESNGAEVLLDVEDMLGHMPKIEVDDTIAEQVRNGRSLGESPGSGQLAIANSSGRLIAIYEATEGELRAVKVLAQ